MSIAARRIPINVEPIEGEALDSWLEALAARTHTSWGDLLTAVGLGGVAPVRRLPQWMVAITTDQQSALYGATGVAPATLASMTLSHYDGRALAIDKTRTTLDHNFPWSPRVGSRFCPQCLSESGGRRLLTWRLGWTFACLRHRCLLADGCPGCRSRPMERHRRFDVIPKPAGCEAADGVRTSKNARCGIDVSTAVTLTFEDEAHPVLAAQRWIDSIIAGARVGSGLHARCDEQGRAVLSSVRAVAIRALSYATPDELEPFIAADLLNAYRRDHPQLPTATLRSDSRQLRIRSPRSASLTAVGVLAALRCLEQPDVQTAANELRWLTKAMRTRKALPCTTNMLSTPGVLRAVELAALGPTLKPSDQLRYRTISSWPSVPSKTAREVKELSRKIPTLLWPKLSLTLAIRGSHQRQLRAALSVALLLVGARIVLKHSVRIMSSPIDEQGASRVLQLLHKQPEWLDISRAFNGLSDYLHDSRVPIDYARRRTLDYRTLLPDNVWFRICRETDTAAHGSARAAVARCYLEERISGAPTGVQDLKPMVRSKIADFPYYLTPALADALDNHALQFLASQNVCGEPVNYEPPVTCFTGLRLPGIDPNEADVDSLHHHLQDGLPLGRAAERAGIELEVARYLLSVYPCPALRDGDASAYFVAKEAFPRHRFIDHYTVEGRSLRDIADIAGVSRQTVARLAKDYEIDLRVGGRPHKLVVERDWLYAEYIVRGRTLPELARDQGVGASTIARWARAHGIPLRPRGSTRKAAG